MKIIINNVSVNLTKNNFIASGGEGQIYAKKNIAYKIYNKTSKMMPLKKINELSLIKNDNIIRPKDIIYNTSNNPIGYTMKYVADTYALCQLFTQAFRNRNNIEHSTIQELVKKLRKIVTDVHLQNILIVDLNELNFLINKKFNEIYAIDTDSYQTPSYSATAIMDSIKDRHSKDFSQKTDWFSFGIISFQMFTGIHPYKGRHTSIKSFNERMLKNISVLNKEVSVPKSCYSFDVIPDIYRQWYRAIFEDGKRIPPPEEFIVKTKINSIIEDVIFGDDVIEINLLQEFKGTIRQICSGPNIKVLTKERYYATNNRYINVSAKNMHIFISNNGKQILSKLNNGNVKFLDTDTNKEIPAQITGQELMSYYDALYVKNNDKINYVEAINVGNKTLITTNTVASVLENATHIFDGVIIQNLLGSYYTSIFPRPKTHHQIHIKELDNYKIIDACFNSGVLMVIGIDKSGKYDRLIFRFDSDYKIYDLRVISNITPTGINFTVLNNGIVISITEHDNIEVFSNKKDSKNIKTIKSNIINFNMKLFSIGNNVYFSQDNKLFSIKMK